MIVHIVIFFPKRNFIDAEDKGIHIQYKPIKKRKDSQPTSINLINNWDQVKFMKISVE